MTNEYGYKKPGAYTQPPLRIRLPCLLRSAIIFTLVFLFSTTSRAETFDTDDFENKVDAAIRSACHGYAIDMIPDVFDSLRDWLNAESQICKEVLNQQNDADVRDILDRSTLSEDRLKYIYSRESWSDKSVSNSDEQIGIDCEMEFMCLKIRRDLLKAKKPVDQASYDIVARHCADEPSAYFCIEKFFEGWPRPLPDARTTAAVEPRSVGRLYSLDSLLAGADEAIDASRAAAAKLQAEAQARAEALRMRQEAEAAKAKETAAQAEKAKAKANQLAKQSAARNANNAASYTGSTPTLTVGQQIWTTRNLESNVFQDGSPIQQAQSKEALEGANNAGQPAWAYYYDEALGNKYGYMYNYFAITSAKSLCPDGFRIPSKGDWQKLFETLGPETAALQMKSAQGWETGMGAPTGGSNSSGFNALPGGDRGGGGGFNGYRQFAHFWSGTLHDNQVDVWKIVLPWWGDEAILSRASKKSMNHVRCVK